MGCFNMKKERGISARVADQMREGILLGGVVLQLQGKGRHQSCEACDVEGK